MFEYIFACRSKYIFPFLVLPEVSQYRVPRGKGGGWGGEEEGGEVYQRGSGRVGRGANERRRKRVGHANVRLPKTDKSLPAHPLDPTVPGAHGRDNYYNRGAVILVSRNCRRYIVVSLECKCS